MSGDDWVVLAFLVFLVVVLVIFAIVELIRDRRESDDE